MKDDDELFDEIEAQLKACGLTRRIEAEHCDQAMKLRMWIKDRIELAVAAKEQEWLSKVKDGRLDVGLLEQWCSRLRSSLLALADHGRILRKATYGDLYNDVLSVATEISHALDALLRSGPDPSRKEGNA